MEASISHLSFFVVYHSLNIYTSEHHFDQAFNLELFLIEPPQCQIISLK